MAEPWLNTTSPPNNAIISNMGASQYFFLARMKVQNSLIKDIIPLRTDFSMKLAADLAGLA